jgi:hypothetical protein
VVQRSWKAVPSPKPAAPCGSQFSSEIVPNEIFLATGRTPKVVTLTRRKLLWMGLVGEKFIERISSPPVLILLEGGDIMVCGGASGVCCGNGSSPPKMLGLRRTLARSLVADLVLWAGDEWGTGEMTIGEPRPKPFISLDLATKGLVVDFLAGVCVGAGVVVGDMGRLRFLDRLAGWFSECSGAGGTSLATLMSTFIVSESEDRLELLPKDGARLRDLEVAGATKVSARFIF